MTSMRAAECGDGKTRVKNLQMKISGKISREENENEL